MFDRNLCIKCASGHKVFQALKRKKIALNFKNDPVTFPNRYKIPVLYPTDFHIFTRSLKNRYFSLPFSAWYPLKGHTFPKKPTGLSMCDLLMDMS